MEKIKSTFIVYFDDPFWVGVYERVSNGKLEVCKITFGAEPKDVEIYSFLLQNWNGFRFSPPVESNTKHEVKINPKRMQRAMAKLLDTQGIGTKSQQALKLQQEERKIARVSKNRKQKEEEKQRQFELSQQKRKEKHRGR